MVPRISLSQFLALGRFGWMFTLSGWDTSKVIVFGRGNLFFIHCLYLLSDWTHVPHIIKRQGGVYEGHFTLHIR